MDKKDSNSGDIPRGNEAKTVETKAKQDGAPQAFPNPDTGLSEEERAKIVNDLQTVSSCIMAEARRRTRNSSASLTSS